MLRPRSKLITAVNTVVIDPISHPDSDIDEESYPTGNVYLPTVPTFQKQPPSLLAGITLKNRVEPTVQQLQTITLEIDQSQSLSCYHSPPQSYCSDHFEQSSSLIFVKKVTNSECLKKKLRRLALVPNKVKLERKDESTVECSICLSDLKGVEERSVGKLNCGHLFCFGCIMQSSKFATKCPYCRAPYRQILKGKRIVKVAEVVPNEDLDDPLDEPCYICGRNDDFQRLLECQYCEYAYCHTYCDTRLRSDQPPTQSWYCLSCQQLLRHQLPSVSANVYDEIYQQQS